MKTLTKTLTILLMLLLAVSCSKDEGLLSTGDELSDVLKGAPVLTTPIYFSGNSSYEGFVPKTGTPIFAGALECWATLTSSGGQWYVLELSEFLPKEISGAPIDLWRYVDINLKITPGGAVKGYWPETWYDFGTPLDGPPNTDVIAQVSGHLGCDLHGPGINKGTLNCTGTFDGSELVIVFKFNGLDNGTPSTMGPGAPWNLVDGPVKVEFTYAFQTPPVAP